MRERRLQLSLLDFSWVIVGESPERALDDTFAVARRAEALGYARYWVGEHHVEGHACGSPQLLAGILAGSTRRIRIGVGAMLLQYWAPLKLAEDFRLLAAMYGRIDLGVGRARADDLQSHRALLDGRPGNDGMLGEQAYGAKLDDLVNHLRCTIPKEHAHHGAPVIPALDAMPEIWICGAGTAGPQAARVGARLCCTLFHGGIAPPVHMENYRAAFRPSVDLAAPHAAIAVAGTCAETEAEALAIRRAFPNPHYVPSVVGAPEQCRARIASLCDEYGVDEVILLDLAPDRARRIQSAELLAQACEIKA